MNERDNEVEDAHTSKGEDGKRGAFYHVYCRTAGIKGEFLLD
jgi:hypothetical protein